MRNGNGRWRVPRVSTGVGDNRYNDKLTDLSASAIDRRKVHEREVLGRLRDRPDRLTGQDVVSYDLAVHDAEQDLAMRAFRREDSAGR